MNVAFQRNVGSFLRAVPAFSATTINTGNDGSPVNGLTIDRNSLVPLALSAMVALQLEITSLGVGETLSVAITSEDSADGISWAALDIGPPDNVAATVLSEANVPYVVTRKAQLGAARRYVRFRYTPTLSASASDAVAIRGGVAIVAGFDELPAEDTPEVVVS